MSSLVVYPLNCLCMYIYIQIYPIDSGHRSLLSMIRVASKDVPFLCVANLSPQPWCLTIPPNWQLEPYFSKKKEEREENHIAVIDLLTQHRLVLIQQPHDCYFL
jgi:hypothetical protein